MPAIRRILFLLLAILLLLLFLAVPGVSWAQTPDTALDAAAGQIARKITAALPPREAVVLNLRNLSSLDAADTAVVRHVIEAELEARGVRLVEPSAEHVDVRLTLSENLDSYVWVADFVRGETPIVAIVALPRPTGGKAAAAAPLTLQKQLVWEQEEPILDVVLLDRDASSQPSLMILEPSRIVLYERREERWELLQTVSVTHPEQGLRDMRGRLEGGQRSNLGNFVAFLPGVQCTGLVASQLGLECKEGKDQWRLRLDNVRTFPVGAYSYMVQARNFFSQLVMPEEPKEDPKLPPFFSSADVLSGHTRYWVFAGVDGRMRLYGLGDEPAILPGLWGSDLAEISSSCSSGMAGHLLATRPGDWTEPDAVTIYDVIERQPIPISPPAEFPGPITALWSVADATTAKAVARNLKTGHYEAYQLSISCGR